MACPLDQIIERVILEEMADCETLTHIELISKCLDRVLKRLEESDVDQIAEQVAEQVDEFLSK